MAYFISNRKHHPHPHQQPQIHHLLNRLSTRHVLSRLCQQQCHWQTKQPTFHSSSPTKRSLLAASQKSKLQRYQIYPNDIPFPSRESSMKFRGWSCITLEDHCGIMSLFPTCWFGTQAWSTTTKPYYAYESLQDRHHRTFLQLLSVDHIRQQQHHLLLIVTQAFKFTDRLTEINLAEKRDAIHRCFVFIA